MRLKLLKQITIIMFGVSALFDLYSGVGGVTKIRDDEWEMFKYYYNSCY